MSPEDRAVVRAIRRKHLQVSKIFPGRLEWERAYVDGLGGAPYLHVPYGPAREACVTRVFATARVGRQLIRRFGYRWGGEWRSQPGAPPGWPNKHKKARKT